MIELVEILLDEGPLAGRERAVLKAGARRALIGRQHRAPGPRAAPRRLALRALGRRRWAVALRTGDVDLLARRGAPVTAGAAARTASPVAAALALALAGACSTALTLPGALALTLAGA